MFGQCTTKHNVLLILYLMQSTLYCKLSHIFMFHLFISIFSCILTRRGEARTCSTASALLSTSWRPSSTPSPSYSRQSSTKEKTSRIKRERLKTEQPFLYSFINPEHSTLVIVIQRHHRL